MPAKILPENFLHVLDELIDTVYKLSFTSAAVHDFLNLKWFESVSSNESQRKLLTSTLFNLAVEDCSQSQ
jgi:hypothetical protein